MKIWTKSGQGGKSYSFLRSGKHQTAIVKFASMYGQLSSYSLCMKSLVFHFSCDWDNILTLKVPEKLPLYGLYVYYVVHICDFGMLRVKPRYGMQEWILWYVMKLGYENKFVRRKLKDYKFCVWNESRVVWTSMMNDYRPLVFARIQKVVTLFVSH